MMAVPVLSQCPSTERLGQRVTPRGGSLFGRLSQCPSAILAHTCGRAHARARARNSLGHWDTGTEPKERQRA
jgi:hypothetical protein